MKLAIEPQDGLVDEEPAVRVTKVAPGDEVTLIVETTDRAGHRWRSANTYRADGAGTVDVGRDAPLRGTYQGVDGSGPWWAMEYTSSGEAPVAFTAPASALAYRCTVHAGSGGQAAIEVTRRWLTAGATSVLMRGDGYLGVCFVPVGVDGPGAGVVVIPGSTGVEAMTPLAALLASHGYRSMVLGYMQAEGLPAALCEIPVERIVDGIHAFAARDGVDPDRLVVVCVSVGTEGALAALAYSGLAVRGVVAISSSSVVWQALSEEGRPPKTSSWSYEGRLLPWVPMHGEKLLPEMLRHALTSRLSRRPRPTAIHLRKAYEPGLRDAEAAARAAIPVEGIDAPLLVISGRDDAMWPSEEMGERLLARRRGHGVGNGDRHLVFPGAGHFIRPPITPTTVTWNADLVSGGTPEGTARAQRAAWDAVLEFLSAARGQHRPLSSPTGSR